MLNDSRRIVAAANKHDDGTIILGIRHWDAFMHRQRDLLEMATAERFPSDTWEQGFVDQFGDFYNRQEAFQIAAKAHQIRNSVGGEQSKGGTLYSEHLY